MNLHCLYWLFFLAEIVQDSGEEQNNAMNFDPSLPAQHQVNYKHGNLFEPRTDESYLGVYSLKVLVGVFCLVL